MKDRQKYPNEHFVRFMARNYYGVSDRSRVRVLDIGSGNGGNSWYLAHEGFTVTALDKDEAAMNSLKQRFAADRFFRDRVSYEVADISRHPMPIHRYDVVADINTLCHVIDPPMYSIADSLKDGGKFFCIAPADDTWRERVSEGKEYTRIVDRFDMRALLLPFTSSTIRRATYQEGDHLMASWICEAHS